MTFNNTYGVLRGILCVFIFMSFGGSCVAQANHDALKKRVLSEYPPALLKIEQYYAHLRGSVKEEEKRYYVDNPIHEGESLAVNRVGIDGLPYPMTVTRKSRFDFAFNGSFAFLKTQRLFASKFDKHEDGTMTLVELENSNDIPRDRVYCLGESGAFLLSYPDSSTTPQINSLGSPKIVQAYLDQKILPALSVSYKLRDLRIYDMIREPDFQFGSIAEIAENGWSLIQFEFVSRSKDLAKAPNRKGRLLVSPDQGWAMRRQELSTERYPRFIDYEIDLAPPTDDQKISLPSKIRFRDPFSVVTSTYENLVHEDVPKSAFALTAFGLPDINKPIAEHVPGQAARWYYVAAGVALTVAVGVKWVAARAARSLKKVA